MLITARFLKPTITGHHPLFISAKTIFRNSSCLTASGVRNSPLSSADRQSCSIHTTSCYQFPGQEWRKKKGQPSNPNAYGPLTDGPDYSFLDGRPTPLGVGKLKRAKEQQEITSKIMKLAAEVDFAVANHDARVQKKKERRTEIIQNKLKPKGSIPPEVLS